MSKREEQRIEREIHKVAKSHDPFAAAVRTTRMPMLVTDPNQPDNPIVFVNDAFIRLTGYQRDEIMGRNCRFLQGTGTNSEDVARVRNAVARREAIEIDLLNYRKDGSSFWNRLLVSPVFDESGELTYFFASQFDVSPDRRRIEELNLAHGAMENEIERRMQDLMQSESRMRFILNASGMGVWTLDLRTDRLVASAHCKANFGRKPDEPFTYEDLKAAVHPEDRERWRQVIVGAIASGSEFSIEYRAITPDNEVRWVEVRGQTTLSSTDEPVTLAGISLDITERREAEEHRRLLARELNHRVKNSLAMVQSIIARSLRTASSLEEAQDIAFGRIAAMAGAQDALTSEGWSSADLRAVVEGAIKPFERSKFAVNGPRVVLNERAVSALALALHELATNATKYGALSTDAGSITIYWQIVSGSDQVLKFHWTETNGPRVTKPSTRGFGSRLIEDVVATSMHGRAQISYLPDGLQYEIEAKLSEATAVTITS